MHGLSEHQLLLVLVTLGVILLCARGVGEVARRLGQPEVLGQLIAGFILGPSVLGLLLPAPYHVFLLDPAVGAGLSLFSWVGAILLLLLAGLEVDLAILRATAKPSFLAATGGIVSSLVTGTLFGVLVLGQPVASGFFLGIVLSVTSASVLSTILLERESMRRRYAQVALAAGVASEVVVWVFLSIASSLGGSSPVLAATISAVSAVGVFLFMLTLGRRGVSWALRRVADTAHIARGTISLVLVLTFAVAALTHALGLHPLLGAFVLGVVLRGAPRVSPLLEQSVQTVTVGLFAPVFFVLAGMRVDVTQLGGPAALGIIALLFAVATLVKVGCGLAGARLGGLGGWEAALVGVGVNLKGGTDVIVAVIGTELGLLSSSLYTMYAVVAMLTVLVSSPLLTLLGTKAPPLASETERLAREEIERRAYMHDVQRVLLPLAPPLLPALAVGVVECMAITKHASRCVFDVTQLIVEQAARNPARGESARGNAARRLLSAVEALPEVALTSRPVRDQHVLDDLLATAKGHDLVVIGARPLQAGAASRSFGEPHDRIIRDVQTDVLVVISTGDDLPCAAVSRILVPINGLAHSLSAGDVAAYLAHGSDAELVLFQVVRPLPVASGEQDKERAGAQPPSREADVGMVQGLAARLGRLGIRVTHCVRTGDDPGGAILHELARERYGLVVLGGYDRGGGSADLGATIPTVVAQDQTPALVFISHR